LINGLLDARKERAPVIAIAGDVESSLIDSEALEELNPYTFFAAAALYIGRLVNPAQLHAVVGSAITTAIAERGPTVISIPGDVASADAPRGAHYVPRPAATIGAATAVDLEAMAALINQATTVAIFGGDGCRTAQEETHTLAQKLSLLRSASHSCSTTSSRCRSRTSRRSSAGLLSPLDSWPAGLAGASRAATRCTPQTDAASRRWSRLSWPPRV
jgi:thiamine pyrophosphate-dependent acetolactate synthase large subunit-like protein